MSTINLLGHNEKNDAGKPVKNPSSLHWTDPQKETVEFPMEKGGVMAFVRSIFSKKSKGARVVKEKHVHEPQNAKASNTGKHDLDAWRKILDDRRKEINGGKQTAVQTMPETRSVLPKVSNMSSPTQPEKPEASGEAQKPAHDNVMPVVKAAVKNEGQETAGEVVTDENSLNVNLVGRGSSAEGPRNIPQRKWGLIIVSACLALAILTWGGLKIYHRTVISDVKALDSQIAALNAELTAQQFTEKEAVEFSKRVEATQDLMNNRIQWGNLLALIETTTLDDVYYSSIQGAESGSVTLSATARSVQAATEQALVLEKTDGIASVKMSTLTNATETRTLTDDTGAETTTDIAVTNFTLDLTLEKELLVL